MYRMSCVLLTSVYHFCVCILRYKVYMICALHKSKDSIVQMFAELVLFIHYSRCKLSIHWLVKTLEFYQSWLNVFRLLLLFCKSKCKIVNKKIVCAFTQAHTHTLARMVSRKFQNKNEICPRKMFRICSFNLHAV